MEIPDKKGLVPLLAILLAALMIIGAVTYILAEDHSQQILPQSETPVIISLAPANGPVGTSITITGSGFTPTNDIHFGNGGIPDVGSSDGKTLIFEVPDELSGCTAFGRFIHPKLAPAYPAGCPTWIQGVAPGQFPVFVRNQNGTSNNAIFTVTPAGLNVIPTITSLEPASGAVGSEIVIRGTGFTPHFNRVNFVGPIGSKEPGGINTVQSSDGQTIDFRIPDVVAHVTGTAPILAGESYQIYVQNDAGNRSNAAAFTIK